MKATTLLSAFRPGSPLASLGVSPEDLAGLAEVAQLLDVPKRTAARYVKRSDFPEPLDRLAAGPVWLRASVVEWGKAHLPLPTGRPRKSPPPQSDTPGYVGDES